MLDTFIDNSSNFPSTVNIKKSSTSDDARLLKEVEDQAAKRIKSAMAIEAPNGFKIVRVESTHNYLDNKNIVYALFTLNGDQIEVEIDAAIERQPQLFWKAIASEIAEQVSLSIALELMKHKNDLCVPNYSKP